MIKEKKALALYEVNEELDKVKETDKSKVIKSYIKKFSNTDEKQGKKLREEIVALNIIKLKNEDIIKIIDFMPENVIELNKIVNEANLDSDETNKILETIKNNK